MGPYANRGVPRRPLAGKIASTPSGSTRGSHPEQLAEELRPYPKREQGPVQFQHGQGCGCVHSAQVAWHVRCTDPPPKPDAETIRGRCLRGEQSTRMNIFASRGISLALTASVDHTDVQDCEYGQERQEDERNRTVCLEVEVEEPGNDERCPNDLDDQERAVLLQPAQVPAVHPFIFGEPGAMVNPTLGLDRGQGRRQMCGFGLAGWRFREASMALEIDWVIIDCVDVAGMSRFWCQALDFEHVWSGPYGGHLLAAKDRSQPRLGLMPCQDARTGKNRLHLDLRPDDQEADVRRLEDTGARRIDIGQSGVPGS